VTYEEFLAWSQIAAMGIFGSVMAGVLVYALRPGNRARFEAAARVPLDLHDTIPPPPGGEGSAVGEVPTPARRNSPHPSSPMRGKEQRLEFAQGDELHGRS